MLGLATAGQQTGEDVLSAEVILPGGRETCSKEILILRDGTYRMVGVVTESVAPCQWSAHGSRSQAERRSPPSQTGKDATSCTAFRAVRTFA